MTETIIVEVDSKIITEEISIIIEAVPVNSTTVVLVKTLMMMKLLRMLISMTTILHTTCMNRWCKINKCLSICNNSYINNPINILLNKKDNNLIHLNSLQVILILVRINKFLHRQRVKLILRLQIPPVLLLLLLLLLKLLDLTILLTIINNSNMTLLKCKCRSNNISNINRCTCKLKATLVLSSKKFLQMEQ